MSFCDDRLNGRKANTGISPLRRYAVPVEMTWVNEGANVNRKSFVSGGEDAATAQDDILKYRIVKG
ncbi:MAG TPA: hypothetical protein VFE38_08725 [Edaphobacter sp.]|nr:hypothetical protein [Edaphobacter sp.]